MLRELIDISWQEDFVRGLSRASGLRVSTHDSRGALIASAGPLSGLARLTGRELKVLPPGLRLTPVPAHDPPAAVAYVEHQGIWYVAAPVYVDDQQAGWVSVGEFRDGQAVPGDLPEVAGLWEQLPILDRRGDSHAVVTARWGARLLAEWCRREARLAAATEEAALIGDIAELLTGRLELQAILDRIVTDTARVMKCGRCSLRLYDPRTDELRIMAVYGLSRQYLQKGVVTRSESAIDDEALRGRLVYVEDAATDPRIQYPEQMRREGIVSILTAGLIHRGQPIGVIRVYTDRRQRFRRTQRHLLRAVASHAAMAIVHARLMEERLRSAQTERQLQLAGDLQARMMRIPAPVHQKVRSARIYQPCFHLGGDFCDVFTLADGRLAAAVADVVGKGVPAALLSSWLRGALYATCQACADLGQVLTRLNRQLCEESLPAEFASLLVVAVDAQRRQAGYASAGHEPLLLLRNRTISCLSEGGLVLGVELSEVYREYGFELSPGDLLLLYTDGLVDATNFAGELFGRSRLLEALVQYGDLPIEQVLENLLWDVRRFAGLADQPDDLTMVGLRILE
jgi:sigma-B regulation protein RsbU (phosphoserine phosphatase)